MEQQLVGLVARGRAIVARDLHVNVAGNRVPPQKVKLLDELGRDIDRIGAGPLGDGDGDGRNAVQLPIRAFGEVPGLQLQRLATHHDVRHVAHVDGAAVAGRKQQQADIGDAVQRLPGHYRQGVIPVADFARHEGAVRRFHLVHELGQRDAIQRKLFGIGLDADLIGRAANKIGKARVIGLGQLDAQVLRQMIKRVRRPSVRRFRLRRQRYR